MLLLRVELDEGLSTSEALDAVDAMSDALYAVPHVESVVTEEGM